jgi:hypothetical protein
LSYYVRVKIGGRDVSKIPATVEGLLDLHFLFQFSERSDGGGINLSLEHLDKKC